MADPIKTRNEKFLKLLELPITLDDIDKINELVLPLTRPEECNLARHVVQMLSLDTILERANNLDDPICACVYAGFLEIVALAPEFCGPILRHADFWSQAFETVTSWQFHEFHQKILRFLFILCMSLKQKHWELMKQARIGEIIVQIGLSAESVSGNEKDKIVNWISLCVNAIYVNFMHHPELYEYLEASGFVQNQHLLDDNTRFTLGHHMTPVEPYAKTPRQECQKQMGGLRCGQCGKKEGKKRFKTCQRCRSIFYCSRKCQKANWKGHKKQCKIFKAEFDA